MDILSIWDYEFFLHGLNMLLVASLFIGIPYMFFRAIKMHKWRKAKYQELSDFVSFRKGSING